MRSHPEVGLTPTPIECLFSMTLLSGEGGAPRAGAPGTPHAPLHPPDTPLATPSHSPYTPRTPPLHPPYTPLTPPLHPPYTPLTTPLHPPDTPLAHSLHPPYTPLHPPYTPLAPPLHPPTPPLASPLTHPITPPCTRLAAGGGRPHGAGGERWSHEGEAVQMKPC